MNNTNQQLYTIYQNIQVFYKYRKLTSLDDLLSQDEFVKKIQKEKYLLLSAISNSYVYNSNGELDNAKLESVKSEVENFNEKSKSANLQLTYLLLIYPNTEAENKRANMMKFINYIRYPNSEILIITPIKVSSGVSKGLNALTLSKEHKQHSFKMFTYSLLNSILPEHELVPTYTILNDEDVTQLKSWYIDINNLPKIFENDPQMVWIGAKVGQVIKYLYPSEITIEAIGYCIVIPYI